MLQPYAIPRSGFTGYGGSSGLIEQDVGTSFNALLSSDAGKKYPIGTCIGYFNESLHGYGVCAYLRYHGGSDSVAGAIGLAAIIWNETAPAHTSVLSSYWHATVTCDLDGGINSGKLAICLGTVTSTVSSALSTARGAWFWIKGLCPDFYTAATTKFHNSVALTSAGSLAAVTGWTVGAADGTIALGSGEILNAGGSLNDDDTNANTIGDVYLLGTGWGI